MIFQPLKGAQFSFFKLLLVCDASLSIIRLFFFKIILLIFIGDSLQLSRIINYYYYFFLCVCVSFMYFVKLFFSLKLNFFFFFFFMILLKVAIELLGSYNYPQLGVY